MNVLIINTYGGSLLLGAKAAKVNVIATMEDTGYGSYLQALNFPNVPRYEARSDWPEKFSTPWCEVNVVSHPPCSAFSGMTFNTAKNTTISHGTDAAAFACHKSVMDYALGHKARSLVIESVIGAYDCAHEAYEETARRYGYAVTYIMLNAASFGVPQWRNRVWVVFHQLKRIPFRVELKPKCVMLSSILSADNSSELSILGGERGRARPAWSKLQPLIKRAGNKWPVGNVSSTLRKMYSLPDHEATVQKFGISRYANANPFVLDHDSFAPVVLGNGVFCDYDRLLSVGEWCAIMGFPRNYKWGEKRKDFRTYLSKGVCPPVATWIMKMIDRNASGWTGPYTHESSEFGGIIDLRPKKAEALALARGEKWEPKKAAAKREPHSAVKQRASSDGPHGHSYVLIDKDAARDLSSPQARFIIAALETSGKAGVTRTALVESAKGDPEGFPTSQPHDRAVGFWLSKLKGQGALRFAE